MAPLYLALPVSILVIGLLSGRSADKLTEGTEKTRQHLIVFAAASMGDVLTEIADSFYRKTGIKVQYNLASSGTLARQIEQGEIPDIYISANERWMNYIDSMGYIAEGTKKEIAGNELVLIAPAGSNFENCCIDSTLDLTSISGTSYFSMGDPAHVPAGTYARQSLQYFGWYNSIETFIIPAKDVRSALLAVELQEAQLGAVYRTDAIRSSKVKIIGTFPERSHSPVSYMAGLCRKNDPAKDFFVFLESQVSVQIKEKYGFKHKL